VQFIFISEKGQRQKMALLIVNIEVKI
jgi:hypothetical protein